MPNTPNTKTNRLLGDERGQSIGPARRSYTSLYFSTLFMFDESFQNQKVQHSRKARKPEDSAQKPETPNPKAASGEGQNALSVPNNKSWA